MRKGSVLVSWVISYSVILLIPIAISVAILLQSKMILVGEVSRSNEALLKQVQQMTDGQIADIMQMGTQLSVDARLVTFMNYSKVPDTTWRLAALDFTRMFTTMRVSNSLIQDFYIYMPEGNIGLTSGSVMDKDLIYKVYHEGTGLSRTDWEQLVSESNAARFVRMKIKGNDNRLDPALVYIRSLTPLADERSASLLVILNTARFEQLIASVKLEEESTVLIADRDGQVLFSTQPNPLPEELGLELMQEAEGEQTRQWGGETATVVHLASDISDWSYFSITPTRVYAKKVTAMRNLTVLGFLLSLMLSAAAVFWFTRRNYKPISRMMEIVSHRVQDNLKQSRNEFSILQQVMTKTLDELNDSDMKLRQQTPLLQANLLGRLLKGRLESGPELNSLLEEHQLGRQSDAYAVVLVQVEDYRQLFRTQETEDTEKKLQFVQLILTNIIGELLGRDHRQCHAEVDGMMAFLVNPVDASSDSEEAGAALIERVREAQAFIHTKFYFYFSAGISGVQAGGVSGIPRLYDEALEALEYKLVRGVGTVIPYEEVKAPKDELYYPIELERQLINFMTAGELQQATEVMNEILMTNFSGGTLSIELAKCLMFEMIGTVLKATEQLRPEAVDESGLQRAELIRRFLKCGSFEEIEVELREVLESVCRIVNQSKRLRHTDLKDQIAEFIHDRFADGNLSLSSIAGHFGLHPTYVSKFFKEQTNRNVIDYINQYRIEMAKPLLLQPMSVQEVSEQVGFLNTNSFIRVFKKYEGITPGQYKSKSF